MRQFFKFFFASLLAMVVAIMIFFIVVFGVIGSLKTSLSNSFNVEEKVYTQSQSILSIDLTESISEIGHKNSIAMFTGGSSNVPSLYEIISAIKHAKTDSKIQGILIKTGGWSNGSAIAEQLREAIIDFKDSDKFVYTYGDYITQNDYYIITAADEIYVNPLGGLELKGLASQLMFFKGTLDKLGVAPEIFYAGQFKSATEPFRLKKMSDPNRTQLAAMQAIIWDQYLTAFSEFSQLDKTTLHDYAVSGEIQTAHDAVSASLITGVYYKDEMEDVLRKKVGLKKDDDVRSIGIADYAKSVSKKQKSDRIAVLFAEGTIVDGEGNGQDQIADIAFTKEIRKIKADKNIKGLVIRINSGGGSALASEKMLREIQMLQETGMPVVVSMGNVAASGGYYMASSADSIFAQQSTITGSIGVFGMMFNISNLLEDKLGITFDVEKNAPHADLPSMSRNMSDREKQMIQNSVDTIYHIFKDRVATGRNMTMEYVDSVGQGRVWMGTTALELGLVDALGGTQRAIESAASLAKIDDYSVAIFPQKDDKLDQFLKGLSGGSIEQQIMKENLIARELGVDYKWFKFLRNLQLHRNTVLTMMPYEIYFE
ncbi:MAG TPA: signal peptide peptidase SppA [Chitinophagaceae bacterium]|nr:signal peptide peptidase SppA [Chitinophagaceae bacterium]